MHREVGPYFIDSDQEAGKCRSMFVFYKGSVTVTHGQGETSTSRK